MQQDNLKPAPPIQIGTEDRFCYTISDECVMCGKCISECPVGAIREQDGRFVIHAETCIDCGTCSAVCPTGAAYRVSYIRNSISATEIDMEKCYFNPGCAARLYKEDIAMRMLKLLQDQFGSVKLHDICCRHTPKVPAGTTIISNCAGCDRRFRSLYQGVNSISFWEVIDQLELPDLPDYGGMKMSVHDSCGYRHKPQVHKAVRNLLRRMNIEIVETQFHGTESICCGDNFYGHVSNEQVEKRIQMRADQFPCKDVVVYCIGCDRAMGEAGLTPHYLADLLFGKNPQRNADTLDEYHQKLDEYIRSH